MEEKERFELFGEHCIKDNNPDARCQLLNTYQVYVILNEQDKHIKELEEEIKKANINNYLADYWLAEKEKQQLKQQFAEKEKEIEQLKKFDDLNKTFFELFRTAFKEPDKVDDLFNTLQTIQEKQDQDKISFAVEQLTLFKNSIVNKMNNPYSVNIKHILSDFDNQIKQLKEGK